MTKQQVLDYCSSLAGAAIDRPFENDFETWVARHTYSRKWFAILMEHGGETIMNVKCDPFEGEMLREAYEGITPAYHMNKTHWITVRISDVSEELIKELIRKSFALTDKRRKTTAHIE